MNALHIYQYHENIYMESSNLIRNVTKLINLNKAVMEMQPQQGSGHSRLLGDGFRHHRPHDLLHLRARFVVVFGAKIPTTQAQRSQRENH